MARVTADYESTAAPGHRLPGRDLADLGLDLPGDQVRAGQLSAIPADGHPVPRCRSRACRLDALGLRVPHGRAVGEWLNALIVGALMLAGGMGSVAVAEQTVGSGLIVVFIAVNPLLIVLINLFWRVVPARLELVGIGVGLAGVVMLTQRAGFQASPSGLVAVATACTCWSLGSVLSQRVVVAGAGGDGLCQRDARGQRAAAGAGRSHRGIDDLAAGTAGRSGLGVSGGVRLAAGLQCLHGPAGSHLGGPGGELYVRESGHRPGARHRLR